MTLPASFWFSLIVLLNVLVVLHSIQSWGYRPRFPSHRIPDNALNPRRPIVQRKIVLYHNFFRTKVRPTASNMLLMTWHAGAARQAQEYAERCVFLKHNPIHEKVVPLLGACGQNLFVAAQKTPWFFAIKDWFLEYQNFTYGAPVRNLRTVGHYTQMVWATAHKVGCGVAYCSGGPWGQFYNYVCHYCPGVFNPSHQHSFSIWLNLTYVRFNQIKNEYEYIYKGQNNTMGNIDGLVQYPYQVGPPCGQCPDECVSGLCTNPCWAKDQYSNCGELARMNIPNLCMQGICNATCTCQTKIHKNFPFL